MTERRRRAAQPGSAETVERKRGRPFADPGCGADPAELVRHPVVLLERDDARADGLMALLREWRMPRAVTRVRSIAAAADQRPARVSGWILSTDVRGSTRELAQSIRALDPRVPVFITAGLYADEVQRWATRLNAPFFPEPPDPSEALAIMDLLEAFETLEISSLAYVVRYAQPERLWPHLARMAADALEGRQPLYTTGSRWSIGSRSRKVLRASSFLELLQARRREACRFGQAS